jgi:hypothetical protein
VKNTWSLRLIDYIGQLTDQAEKEEKKTNFQKVTATLDASVKIYSSRVDSVHTDTYKMLGMCCILLCVINLELGCIGFLTFLELSHDQAA